jgi:hypothetical protein
MRYIYFIGLTVLLQGCSANFVGRMHVDRNTKEIVEFRRYLEEINFMEYFNEYKIYTRSDLKDQRIKDFCSKYNIRYIYIQPQTTSTVEHFKNSGNTIMFWYNNLIFFEANHSLIFDYSKEGLILEEGIPKRHKIANRVFAF